MLDENQTPNAGASGTKGENPNTEPPKAGPENQPAETPTQPIPPTAKVEIKDGKVLVDGKSYVSESDLIASKRSLEKQLEQQQSAHEQAVNATKLELSQAQKQVAELNAKLKETEEARSAGASSDEEVAGIKQELEASKASLESLKADAGKALEYRRALIITKYGVSEDTIKSKSMPELDAFEEALKAVSTAKGGIGPYAAGAPGGEAAPLSDADRARRVLDNTPVRGVRNPQNE